MAWNLSHDASARDLSVVSDGSQNLPSAEPVETRTPFDILHRLQGLRDHKRFCDIRVNVQGKIFPIHKVVFAAWSPVFAAQVPDTVKSFDKEEVLINFNNSQVFEDFLNFLYVGPMVLTESNVEQLLHLAVSFKMEALITACEEFWRYNIHLENYITIYFLSRKYNLTSLEGVIISYVIGNMSEITKHGELFSLSAPKFLSFLSSRKMEQLERDVKLALIVAWVSANMNERENYVLFLLNKIDWTAPVDNLLLDISCTENIFSASEFCMFQLLQTLANQGHSLGHFAPVFSRLGQMYSVMLGDVLRPNLIQPVADEPVIPIPLIYRSHADTAKSSTESGDSGHVSVKRDIAINTDIDSSYFIDCFPSSNEKGQSVSISSQEQEPSQVSSENSYMDSRTVSEGETMGAQARERTVGKEPDNLPVVIPGKRKRGRPKKVIGLDTCKSKSSLKVKITKDTVPKRKVGRPRKKIEEDSGCSTVKVKIEAVSDDEESSPLPSTADQVEKWDDQSDSDWADTLAAESSRKKAKESTRRKRKKVRKKELLKPLNCSYEDCSYVTKRQVLLERHIEKVHKLNLNLKCRQCDFQTPLMRELCAHLKTHYQGPMYACDRPACTFETMSMRLLVWHFMEHDGDRRYQCDICNKSFHVMNRLNDHRKLHLGRQFTCDICEKTFPTKGRMVAHRAVHSDQQPYLCDTCGFTTKHQSHLTSHRRIHTGEVLRCQFPGCNYSTPKQGHMTQHMNSHLNIRDHICQVCAKSFSNRSKLLRHELIHRDKKLFQCTSCDYQTIRRDRLKLHIASHGQTFQPDSYIKL